MPRLPKLSTLLLLLLTSTALCHGAAYRSAFYESILLDPDAADFSSDIDAPPGFSHPFSSWKRLGNAIIDALSPGSPHYSLLQYGYQDSLLNFRTEMNFVAGYDHRLEEDKSYGFIWKGIRLKSRINRNFSANALWWNGMYSFDRDAAESLSPLIDGYFTHTSTQTRLDNLNADMRYQNSWLKLNLARGRPSIGSNLTGSIILSDRVNDYAYFEAEGRLGAVTFSLLHGSLVADSARVAAKLADLDLPDKYVAFHEIGWQINPAWKAFAGEGVIYGDRGLDLNYLLPHTFWRVTEHNQHDRDNVVIYTGIEGKPHRNLGFWGHIVLDEFSYAKTFSNWWGNKWGIQSGIALDMPGLSLCEKAPSLSAEIVAVRPWTYTHYMNHTMYSHDGRSLGYPSGANLAAINMELEYPLNRSFCLGAVARWMRQGDVGSDWHMNYQDYVPPSQMQTYETRWFEGKRTDSFQLGSLLKIRLAHHQLYLGQRSQFIRSWKHRAFAGWAFCF